MTDKSISFDQLETVEQADLLLNWLYDGLEGIALLIDAGHKEQAASIARICTSAVHHHTLPLEDTIAAVNGGADFPDAQPKEWVQIDGGRK